MEGMNNILQEVGREHQIILAVFSMLLLAVWLILAYHIRGTMLLIQKENRFFSPNQAWIVAIPLVNIFYNFIIIRRFTDSLNNEFYDRKEAIDENPTLRQGYFMAFSYLAANFPLPIFIGYLVFVICLVYYLNYLIKVLAYKKLLKQPRPSSDSEAPIGEE